MNLERLKGAVAMAALLAGLGWEQGARAAETTDPAVQKVRRHVQALKESRRVASADRPQAARRSEKQSGLFQPAAFVPPPRPQAPPRVTEAQAIQVEPLPPQPEPQPQVSAAEPGQQAQTPPQPEAPGVLTRRGMLVVEPSLEYQHTDVNRFVVGGVAILDTVLVGSVEATQANRDVVTATLGFRYGLTNRLEAELRIPYMYRSDETTNTVVSASSTGPVTTSLDDHGLGDIEGALHYQVNDGTGTWPVFVANFRAKSTTGTGPFDVSRNGLGIEEELATGSGFWGFEPSVTVIAPSDPAVFYGNIGYLWNVKKSIDKTVGTRRITDVDPGDAIRFGVGMGVALNEKVSFSIGYQHDWIMGTETRFTNGEFTSESLSVGSLTFGVNWQMTDNAALNVSVGIGVTSDSPDVRLMARVPVALTLF